MQITCLTNKIQLASLFDYKQIKKEIMDVWTDGDPDFNYNLVGRTKSTTYV